MTEHAANAPRETDGLWVYAQMIRWGQLAPSRAAENAAASVFRADVYRQSLPKAGAGMPPSPSFDRVEFSPTDVPAYLRRFELQTPFADARLL